MTAKEIIKITGVPVVVASLCCLSPLILVLTGLSAVSFASSLADTLYGEYKWLFRAAGIILLSGAAIAYLRRARGICTIDEAKKRRREIINLFALVLTVGAIGYVFFLYVVIHYTGVFAGIWR